MHINLFKHAKLGSLVMAGALASSMAHATTFNIGGFEVNMDTTVSYWRDLAVPVIEI